jgi:phospholipase D1/2
MPEAIKSEVEFDIEDPISEQFFNDVWKFYARQNTRIYEEVFHTFPTDGVSF